jgi:tetratricopeptide (TPR) repeat protein
MDVGTPSLVSWAIPLVLIAAGLAAYHNSFRGVFLFDDQTRIVEDQKIRQLWPPWAVMAGSTRPILGLSIAANYAIGGLDVRGYHAFNLAVHLLAGLVLFGIVRLTLESDTLRARFGGRAPWLAMAVAAIWIVHPLQTESVTYVIQRAESLMGLFFLLTLYCAIRAWRSPHPQRWQVAAVAACALGMGTKEVMVSAPILVVLHDWVFVAGPFKDILRRRRGLYAGLAATWLVLGALLATSRAEEQTFMVSGLTPWRYAMTQFGVIVHYLRLSFWPHPLVLDYTWPMADRASAVAPWAAVVLALVAATALALARRSPAGFCGAWFFLVLAPTSSVLPIADVAFEHRMYLPLAAVIALSVTGGYRLLEHLARRCGATDAPRRWLMASLVVGLVAVLGCLTVRRNEDYLSDLAMWSDVVRKVPDNPRGHQNLGFILGKRGERGEEIRQYAEALRLKPDYAQAHYTLGVALFEQGQVGDAVAHYREALRLNPRHLKAHNNLAAALQSQRQFTEAIAHYSEALRLDPRDADVRYNLGTALLEDGQIKEAIAQYEAALRLKPAFPDAHYNLGVALAAHGDLPGAIAHLSEALRLRPDDAVARESLGRALARQASGKP